MIEERCAAQKLPDLSGKSAVQAAEALDDAGFRWKSETKGGYRRYVHADLSEVWIRPNGEVIRLSPKIKRGLEKGYHHRYDQNGNRTPSHSTGEKIVP